MFSDIGPFEVIALGVVIVALYIVPSVIAFRRRHPNRLLVLTVNLVFGCTLIGWAIALYLATRSAPARSQSL
ncbi:superinfection immunity protein [Streptomyces roseoverticillatus]|uniref:superinfection immunity protein n=1 Tax=Streptomyces roseoverticillatus TaxID=66429 RepID=UPI001F3BACF0|nr:superinfection immunity protein [Streptomyces roseoverticillatus]MCF3101227.1 superinfection immunity protein [Streptomyces roseoverticillatus]